MSAKILEWPDCRWCSGLIAWDDFNGWFHLGRAENQFVTWCFPEKDWDEPPIGPGPSAAPRDGRLSVREREYGLKLEED